MQTISLDEEIELIEGIPYDIDFDQDFSAICLNGQPITDMPVASIIGFLNNPKSGVQILDGSIPIHCTGEEYRCRQDFWEHFAKWEKKEKRREEKWKKGKAERKAYMNRVFRRLDDCDNLLKERW